jgi:hypothetical protein
MVQYGTINRGTVPSNYGYSCIVSLKPVLGNKNVKSPIDMLSRLGNTNPIDPKLASERTKKEKTTLFSSTMSNGLQDTTKE